jgi:hypothetical protein
VTEEMNGWGIADKSPGQKKSKIISRDVMLSVLEIVVCLH